MPSPSPLPAAPAVRLPASGAGSALREALEASLAPATRRAYRTAGRAWADWAARRGEDALPARPEAVAEYLADRAAGGASAATLRMAVAAVGFAHRAAGEDSPCSAEVVRAAMRGLARQAAAAGRAPRQAAGLTRDAVAAIRASVGDAADRSVRAARDIAIVSVLADAGLRRSEAAELRWDAIRRERDGSGRITVRRSKTDAEGAGAVVAVTPAAMADLDRLRRLRPGGDLVYCLGPQQISRRIAALALAAGLGAGYSGHSGRVGMAMAMTRAGAPAAAVMRQGRWSSARMVGLYTRGESAAAALRYLRDG